ncbi:MAG: polyribonucleotide nucleotidyltransferase [Candidatus Tectomicrobia bacterium]|nr:polyribonucleotide nucleotidyltransferase [Candidatus Tectomicrobia bacterium]
MKHRVSAMIGGRTLTLETGELARQASGAVLVTYGETTLLSAAVADKVIRREGLSFFPLTIEYREKPYAAGRYPGGFIKREGRLSDRETLVCRIIDRSVRPLFPDGFKCETLVHTLVFSADQQNDPEALGIIGSSAALAVSDIPHLGPVGSVRVGRVDGELLINPTIDEQALSTLNLVVAGTADAISMVEGEAREEPESVIIDALMLAHEEIQKIVAMQEELVRRGGVEKRALQPKSFDPDLVNRVRGLVHEKIKEALVIAQKHERQNRLDAVLEETLLKIQEDDAEGALDVRDIYRAFEKEELRALITEKGLRADGRGLTDIRPVSCRAGLFPRPHGSALFTRGETQALAIVTLGTSEDEQRTDGLLGKSSKRFTLHYNFPGFSVGEANPIRGVGRREIGHGALAERALQSLLPTATEFPYTMRIVAEVLESNGSSSMASVCAGSLALMDAGVPLRAPVAGIAMGLIKDQKVSILSDILGVEDHLGDMDFKVAGTARGITAIQMDIKIHGVTRDILEPALEQARQGRLHILATMNATLAAPRAEISVYAPRIFTIKINPDKIRDVIGPGGKMIRSITEATQSSIDISDDGTILIATPSNERAQQAVAMIRELTQEAEVGRLYKGKVKRIVDFGAFIEIFPGTDGLCHISQIADYRVRNITDELHEGDETYVKVIDVDAHGRVKLSRKEALREMAAAAPTES